MILACDPGPERSALVLYDSTLERPVGHWLLPNSEVRDVLDEYHHTPLVIEYTPPYALHMKTGRAYVPNQVVLTAIEIGRFIERNEPKKSILISRIDIKKHLLGRSNGTDADVTQSILARYGGTRKNAVGTKATPGPLYGIKKDIWAALAVAITYSETTENRGLGA